VKTIYDFRPADAGTIYTEILICHTRRLPAELKESMQGLAEEIYGLDPGTAKELAEIELEAFLEHNKAESENTPEKERESHWENVRKLLTQYYLILEKQFRQFEISILPAEIAAVDLAWWKDHNRKDYEKVQKGLIRKYMKLYRLPEEAASRIATAEIEAVKTYDNVKTGKDNAAWIGVERANVEAFRILKRELRNVYQTK